jgi:hypothetical protein
MYQHFPREFLFANRQSSLSGLIFVYVNNTIDRSANESFIFNEIVIFIKTQCVYSN